MWSWNDSSFFEYGITSAQSASNLASSTPVQSCLGGWYAGGVYGRSHGAVLALGQRAEPEFHPVLHRIDYEYLAIQVQWRIETAITAPLTHRT
jgi:hypothetical protein